MRLSGAYKQTSCFICLGDADFELNHILSACSQCSVCAHQRCWTRWRRRQKLSVLRSRLLGQNRVDPLSCGVCKTGLARLQDEPDAALLWACSDPPQSLQDELLRVIGRMLQRRGRDDVSVWTPTLALVLTCVVFISLGVCVGLLANGTNPGDVFLGREAVWAQSPQSS